MHTVNAEYQNQFLYGEIPLTHLSYFAHPRLLNKFRFYGRFRHVFIRRKEFERPCAKFQIHFQSQYNQECSRGFNLEFRVLLLLFFKKTSSHFFWKGCQAKFQIQLKGVWPTPTTYIYFVMKRSQTSLMWQSERFGFHNIPKHLAQTIQNSVTKHFL